MWPSLAAAARTHAARRAATNRDRTDRHVALLAAYGLTPATCPVCLVCPELPDTPRSTR